jgi:hypothetical protein
MRVPNGWQAWFKPRDGWIPKAYLLSSETVSLSLYTMSVNYCRGLLLEVAGGPHLRYPTESTRMQYASCRHGPRILDAQVKDILAKS